MKLLAAPSRLEFLTALAIRMRLPDVRVVPNYCCDADTVSKEAMGQFVFKDISFPNLQILDMLTTI